MAVGRCSNQTDWPNIFTISMLFVSLTYTAIYSNSSVNKKGRYYFLSLGSGKLDKRIIEYFNGKYRIDDFVLSGMNFVTDMDVSARTNVLAYLKVIRRIGRVKGFSPACYECFGDDASFCLGGNSNGIDFMLYDLEMAVMHRFKNYRRGLEEAEAHKGNSPGRGAADETQGRPGLY